MNCKNCNNPGMKLDNVIQTEEESRTTEFWICNKCKSVEVKEIE